MSFLVTAALALSVLVALPAIAHLFRRGRARPLPFPPAALVPAARTLARRERRLEDKVLLSVRALAILMLAIVGATPLVQCSRLSLSRGSGGSLAVGLVLDDSLSMRARLPDGETRWKRAHDAARDLLASTREGDSVAIVLAGKPARVVLGSTTDLALARSLLDGLRPSDRGTDLAGAVALARSVLSDVGQRPRRIVLLSDHASEPFAAGTPAPWAPLPELARAVPDCGIVAAERHGARVVAAVACNRADAARGRRVEVTPLAGSGVAPAADARPAAVDAPPPPAQRARADAALDARAGAQSVTLAVPAKEGLLAVRLTGADALGHDDVAPVSPDESALAVAVVADSARSGVVTGGATPLEQALIALEAELALRPLAVLPDEASELDAFGLVLLDDPRGLGPEARAGLSGFVERGGLAVALLGPSVASVEIGATLEPFAFGAARWERKPATPGAKVASLGFIGPEAASLAELALEGRVVLDVGRLRDARVVAEFADGAPFVIERKLGRGTAVTITLPSSPAESDFALRPGFVALLDHFVTEARQRKGVRRSAVGTAWSFGAARPRVEGPEGPLELSESNQGRLANPVVRGLYRVTESGREELRTAVLETDEITLEPRPPATEKMTDVVQGGARGVDVSNEFGWALVALLVIELALRAVRALRGGFRTAAAP